MDFKQKRVKQYQFVIRIILMFSVLHLAINTSLFAQELTTIQADRPDQTETPFTVPKNYFQMEFGFLMEQNEDDIQSFTHPSILSKIGLTDNFELGIITEIATLKYNLETFSGLNPITFRFKENICQEKGLLPTTSFIGYLTVPYFASENFKATYFAPAFRFTMQHTLTSKLSLSYNIGAEWDGETAEPIFIYTFSTGYSINENTSIYTELYGFAPQKSKSDHRFDSGITYLLNPNLLFDVSGGVGLTDNTLKYYLAIGFCFRSKI